MSRRRVHHEEHEEHENHERWLITYADMITLLMVLFIVLFSISQVDLAKFERFKAGLSEFGNGSDALVALQETGLLSEPQLARLDRAATALADEEERRTATTATLDQAEAAIAQDLAAAGLGEAVQFRREVRGLVVSVASDRVLFDPGSDRLTGDGRAVVAVLGDVLAPLANQLAVEGHTDAVPISNPRFPSNWELSTARATSVLRALVEGQGIAPGRLSAAGYADQRPVGDNGTAAGRAANRRVEIVVLATPATTSAEEAEA